MKPWQQKRDYARYFKIKMATNDNDNNSMSKKKKLKTGNERRTNNLNDSTCSEFEFPDTDWHVDNHSSSYYLSTLQDEIEYSPPNDFELVDHIDEVQDSIQDDLDLPEEIDPEILPTAEYARGSVLYTQSQKECR